MSSKKNHTTPFWLLIVIIVVQLFFWFLLFNMLRGNMLFNLLPPVRRMLFLQEEQFRVQTILLLILIAESILLWRIRKRPYPRILGWVYILSLTAALVVLPVAKLIGHELYLFLSRPNLLLWWFLIILAHACLIRLLQRVYFPKDPRSGNTVDWGDAIDELL